MNIPILPQTLYIIASDRNLSLAASAELFRLSGLSLDAEYLNTIRSRKGMVPV